MGDEQMKFKKEYYFPLVLLAILAILFLQPEAGFLGAVPIEEIYECPEGFSENTSVKPCDKATFTGIPKCTWDLSACDNYCAEDNDCKIIVPKPNDCKMFFEPEDAVKIGYCKESFCVWQEVPEAERECSATELFIQDYKYILAIVLVLLIGYFIFEFDWKGKRGFI